MNTANSTVPCIGKSTISYGSSQSLGSNKINTESENLSTELLNNAVQDFGKPGSSTLYLIIHNPNNQERQS